MERLARFPGDNCGSSYLNQKFDKYLARRLRGENYLDDGDTSRVSLINEQVAYFEDYWKRQKETEMFPKGDLRIMPSGGWVPIKGLRANEDKRFQKGRMLMDGYDN